MSNNVVIKGDRPNFFDQIMSRYKSTGRSVWKIQVSGSFLERTLSELHLDRHETGTNQSENNS